MATADVAKSKDELLRRLIGKPGFGGIGEQVDAGKIKLIVIIDEDKDDTRELLKIIPNVIHGIPVLKRRRRTAVFL